MTRGKVSLWPVTSSWGATHFVSYFDDRISAKLRFCDAVVDTGPRFSKFYERKFMFQLVETDTISKAFLETIISKKYDFRSPVF